MIFPGGYTTYVPYKNANGSYRTGLTPERLVELGLTEEDYNVYLPGSKVSQYRSNQPITDEVTKAWLSVHPDYQNKTHGI